MHRLRVFLSYSRKDCESIEFIGAVLREIGLAPVWDRDIRPGTPFTDAIKSQIATAHLFMPVLTPSTRESPWVHQEIGFAIGIDVPVLPIALGSLPGEMLSGIQALSVKEDLSDLLSKLRVVDFQALVLPHKFEPELERLGVSSQIADSPEERARTLVDYAQAAPESGRVRQRVIFSSFSLPNADPFDPSWDAIDSPRRRSEFYRRVLRREREVLEVHARQSGCSLLLHPFSTSPSDSSAQQARIRLLIRFLASVPENMITVAVTKEEMRDSLTLVGDWFGARASPPRAQSDYRQTFFCRHGPTVLRWVRDFDRKLDETLARTGVYPDRSRDLAIEQLEARLRSLAINQ
jgi:hypothetical protein